MKKMGILALIGAALAFAPGTALAEDGDAGKIEYMSNCATCHGLNGKGDGPYLKFLMVSKYVPSSLPNLTVLAKSNDGIFPSNRVYEVIDGRAEVRAHGPRLMPIWGVEYSKEAAEYYRSVFRVNDAEAFVSKRIGSLVAYIQSIQEK